MSESVRITDVAPRDGLQNESAIVPTADKIRLVRALVAAGVDEVEVSSFVSPKWIPQLADAADVFSAVAEEKPAGVLFSALVPNEKGMAAALDVNQRSGRRVIDKVAVFTAASETFSKRNTNATIAETIDRFRPVAASAAAAGLALRGYVSCVVRCPFEGDIAPERVAEVAIRLEALGATEIDLGETIGAGTPDTVRSLLEVVLPRLGKSTLVTLHLHDTQGRAADCVAAALAMGVRSFDGAVGGLGGCPYASTPGRRAPGNIATETLVATVEQAGYRTRVDRARLVEAGRLAAALRSA